jgi:hypothetical protein
LVDEGKEPSPQLYEQPELKTEELFYWSAFQDLSSERALGTGVGPIPYSAIRRYADEFDIVGRDEFEYFLGILQAMDSEYLSIVNSTDRDKDTLVPISDVEGQHKLFARLKARASRK